MKPIVCCRPMEDDSEGEGEGLNRTKKTVAEEGAELRQAPLNGEGYALCRGKGRSCSRLLRLLKHCHDRLDPLHSKTALRIADIQLPEHTNNASASQSISPRSAQLQEQ